MWNLAKISAVVAVGFLAAASAWANGGPGPDAPRGDRPPPFAGIAVPKTPVCFAVAGPGPRRLKASTAVRVLANRPYGIAVAFEALTLGGGPLAIPPAQLVVRINGKKVPIGTERVQIASGGPTSGYGVEIPIAIEIEMKGAGFNPAGQYGGNLVLSII